MAEMKDMYKITKFVSELSVEEIMSTRSEKSSTILANVSKMYVKKARWYQKRRKLNAKLGKIVVNAKRHGYLSAHDDKVIDVTKSGMHLIGKKFYFFRVGLWDESLKAYPNLLKIVGAGTIGALLIFLLNLFF